MNRINKLQPFKCLVLQNFPFIEADFDALTNYELLCKVVDYVKGIGSSQVDTINKVNEFVNFFNNLDLSEEINKKLDDLVTDGTLEQIINENLFNELNTKIDAVDSKADSITDRIDLINYVNVKNIGATGDGVTDDTEAIMNAIALNKPLYFPEGIYLISETISLIDSVNWIGQGNKSIINRIGNINPIIDFSGCDNLRLKDFATTNGTFKVYPTPGVGETIESLIKDKTIFIENVTCSLNEANVSNKTNWQGLYISTPRPSTYERNFNDALYPRYPIEISNHSGYNAININNILEDDDGNVETVVDNSAIGITDKCLGSAPTIFVDMKAPRNVINVKNRTGETVSNSTSNPDSVFQVGHQGHLAIGCSVYSETGASGTGTIKLKDNNPSIRMYDTNYPNNINVLISRNNHLEFLSNGASAGYFDEVQNMNLAKKLKMNGTEHEGAIRFRSTYSNLDYYMFINDKGLMKMNGVANSGDQTTNAGYTLLYNASGTTANRPTSRLTNDWQTIGFQYFDTTLGKPIWWKGTGWVDANGNSV